VCKANEYGKERGSIKRRERERKKFTRTLKDELY